MKRAHCPVLHRQKSWSMTSTEDTEVITLQCTTGGKGGYTQEKRYKRVHNKHKSSVLNLFFRLFTFFIFPLNDDYLNQSSLSLPPPSEQLIMQQFVLLVRCSDTCCCWNTMGSYSNVMALTVLLQLFLLQLGPHL